MNSWRSRLMLCAVYSLATIWHVYVTKDVSNTVFGMFVYHGSAVLLELGLVCLTPSIVVGRLCDHMETLCIVSMIANALGWALYLAYASPVFYNTFIWGLGYVQLIRLSLPDRYDADHYGVSLFPRGDPRRS